MARRGEAIYKRKDGRWEARYIHHYENGKAKYRYLYAESYALVKEKRIAELCMMKETVHGVRKEAAKFSELCAAWLVHTKPSVKESTFSRYYRIVQAYILPAFGETNAEKLQTKDYEAFAERLLSGGAGRTPLSGKTVSDILCVLKSILRYAAACGHSCTVPDGVRVCVKRSRIRDIVPNSIRQDIERRLADSSETDALGVIFALYTGVRIGELCGLRWGDVDFDVGCVYINRTVERIADLSGGAAKTKVILSEPKTEKSARCIPLQRFLLERLSTVRKGDECYILTGSTRYTEPHQYYIRYKKLMEKIGVQGYTFHALRHTFATRCVEMGFDTKTLSELLGHASVSTTLAIYVHPTYEQKRLQMEMLKPAFENTCY